MLIQHLPNFQKLSARARSQPTCERAQTALLARSGLPPDFQGVYELFAVVTHKGRSADGGHYMGWVKQDGDKWLVFDDDLVSESDAEFVKNLKGGGDEHMSYLQFYRAKKGGI